MKYKARWISCSLLAGLTILISSCRKTEPELRLLHSQHLEFPSASAIEFYRERLYLFGDDAPYVLVLDTAYRVVDSIAFLESRLPRLSKQEKPDIEAAALLRQGDADVLVGIGSLSSAARFRHFSFQLNSRTMQPFTLMTPGVSLPGIEQLNIEGAAVVNHRMVLANRANNATKKNHLVIQVSQDSFSVSEFILPQTDRVAGVSGLFYYAEEDLLFFTASTEETPDAIQDGAIGDSYLGWVEGASGKLSRASVRADGLINLVKISPKLDAQKIESVCVERKTGRVFLLHLVADNDDGGSRIFKMEFQR